MKDHLIFDATNATTIADTDSVGAFVRANDGVLITRHALNDDTKASLISQGLVLTSKLNGVVGNSYSFQVIDTGGAGPLTYTEIAGAIIVDLVGLTPTSAQVATLLSASAYADVAVGTPTGNVIVAAAQSFSGGTDSSVHQHLDVYSPMIDGSGNPITSTNGAINVNMVNALSVDIDGVYNGVSNLNPDNAGLIAHTRAASPGDTNQTFRSTGANPSADDVSATNVHALDVNSFGMMWDGSNWDRMVGNSTDGLLVDISNTSIAVTQSTSPWVVSDAALALTSIIATPETGAAINVSKNIIATPLVDRKYVWIYNNDNQKMFIGGAGVTTADGFPISPGSYMELRAGSAVDIEFVSGKASHLIRTLELK